MTQPRTPDGVISASAARIAKAREATKAISEEVAVKRAAAANPSTVDTNTGQESP